MILIAAGAILAFAIGDPDAGAVNLPTIGYILLGVGFLGILMSLLFMMSFSPFARGDRTNV